MAMRRVGMIVSALTAVTVAPGCANGTNGSQEPAPQTNSPGTGAATEAPAESEAPKETFKLSIMANLHTPEVPTDTIEKLVEEATNTVLDIQWVPDGTYDEKMNASFATGTLPQATYIKNQTSLIMLRDAIRNNQFWEIGPLLSDYPNLSKLNPDVLKNTSVDGKIYALYQERPLSRQGLIFRKDWADTLGLTAPTNVDELYAMLKAFKENDPDGNGAHYTIGLTDRNDLVYGCVGADRLEAARRGYRGLVERLRADADGRLVVPDICIGTSAGDYRNYVTRPVSDNDLHGVGAFLLACAAMESLEEGEERNR